MTEDYADFLEFPLKPGTEMSDGDLHDETGKEVPARMLQTTAEGMGKTQDPDSVVAAIAQLSKARKYLGMARTTLEGVSEGMMTDLARGEATQEIITSCGWIEEARECLKHPLRGEEVDDSGFDVFGQYVEGNGHSNPGEKNRAWAHGKGSRFVKPLSEDESESEEIV